MDTGPIHTAYSPVYQFMRVKRKYATMWNDPVGHCFAYDFHNPLINGKYDSDYDNKYEDDSSSASDADSISEYTVQRGCATPATPPLAPNVIDVSPFPLMAVHSMQAYPDCSCSKSTITSHISDSSHRTPMLLAMRSNSDVSLRSVSSSLSMHSHTNTPLISLRSLSNIQAA